MTALSSAVMCCQVLSKRWLLSFFPHFPFFHQSPKKIQELEEVLFINRLFLWVSSSGFSFIFLLNPFFFSLSLYFFFFSFSSSGLSFLQLFFFRIPFSSVAFLQVFPFSSGFIFFFSFSLQYLPFRFFRNQTFSSVF